jgi:hypothetical protein
MPRLPPEWRRTFWRWHDRLIDFADTASGRMTILAVGMVISLGGMLAIDVYRGNDGLLRLLTSYFSNG